MVEDAAGIEFDFDMLLTRLYLIATLGRGHLGVFRLGKADIIKVITPIMNAVQKKSFRKFMALACKSS